MAKVFTYPDLQEFFREKNYKVVVAADGEPVVHERENDKIIAKTKAGGVSVALEPIVKASHGTYITIGRTPDERKVLNEQGKVKIDFNDNDSYTLKRFFLTEEERDLYYNGFSNQTLWPLCHIAFQKPEFHKNWFEGYTRINKKFAQVIREELKGKTFLWINDYQMSMVPTYLEKPKDTLLGMFWHIPWPAWEIFRILPQKVQILESLLKCDFIGFHRSYHVLNFFRTVERELEARIDREKNEIHYNKHVTTVKNLPLGIDVDVIKSLYQPQQKPSLMDNIVKYFFEPKAEDKEIDHYFKRYKVILGIDRLDYTKGIPSRLKALDRFFSLYPQYLGKVVYVGIIALSREKIPAYEKVREEVIEVANGINEKYASHKWRPVEFIFSTFPRKELINFYSKANLCLITPLDDGMNLVSKEFVIASSLTPDPGMIILSQFAGSAIDLESAIIVNPYDIEQVAEAIKKGLDMSKKERQTKLDDMVDVLEERNIYQWGKDFAKETEAGAKSNQ